MESNQLFHEMMHAYRAYQETTASYKESTLNGEIEAWYAQYLYTSNLPEYKDSKWEDRDNTAPRRRRIKSLTNYIDNKGNLLPGVNRTDLENKIKQLKSLPHYTKGKGLPIGNETSQILAIYYLNNLDHYVKEQLKIKHYVRYMDDFILFHHDKEYLKECLEKIQKLTDEMIKKVEAVAAEKEKEIISKKTCPGSDSRSTPAGWKHCRQYTRRTHLLQ